jgi:stage III sporulation protein AE
MKKGLYLYILIIIIILIPKNIYANNSVNANSVLEEQKSGFGIKEFLKEAESYVPDTFKDLDISNIFNMAVSGNIDNISLFKKILNLLGSQVTDTIKILINILVIVLVHSILKSIADSIESTNISKIIYYVQYILIVTIIMSNFSDIISSVKETIENLIGFAESLIPLLITLMMYTGSIATTAVIEPILLFLIEFIANLMKTLIIPAISIITVLVILSKITDRVQINKLGSFMKSSVVWFLGIILTLFVGILSLEGTLTSSVDGITAKTTKAAVSSLIPVVRKNIR